MPRAGLTPDLIVLAAATLADRDGLERVTVSAVARLVGVKPASVYAHLEGADDLLRRVTQLALEEMAERAADAVAGGAENRCTKAEYRVPAPAEVAVLPSPKSTSESEKSPLIMVVPSSSVLMAWGSAPDPDPPLEARTQRTEPSAASHSVNEDGTVPPRADSRDVPSPKSTAVPVNCPVTTEVPSESALTPDAVTSAVPLGEAAMRTQRTEPSTANFSVKLAPFGSVR